MADETPNEGAPTDVVSQFVDLAQGSGETPPPSPGDQSPPPSKTTAVDTTEPAAASAESKASSSESSEESSDEESKDASKKPANWEKRYKDQQRHLSKVERDNKQLRDQLDLLEKKLNGEYEEPPEPSEEQKAEFERLKARVDASKRMAFKAMGEEQVNSLLFDEEAPWRQLEKEKPWLGKRALASEDPVGEALQILKEEEVLTKFGSDPDKVLEKAEAELRPKLWKEFTEQMRTGKAPTTGAKVPGLSHVRGGGEEPKPEEKYELDETFLSSINPHLSSIGK